LRDSPIPSASSDLDEIGLDTNPLGCPSEASRSSRGCEKHHGGGLNDFKVNIPEFKGKLDPNEFLDWMQIVERVFDYKNISDEQR